jgi:PAS domain S-box-containing protein
MSGQTGCFSLHAAASRADNPPVKQPMKSRYRNPTADRASNPVRQGARSGQPSRRAAVLGLLLASLISLAAALPEYQLDTWDMREGLPEDSSTCMAQTPDGYVWFGTFAGLVRFDGVRFTVFDPSNTPELPHAGIVNLHVDARGRLWVSTMRGLVVSEPGRRPRFQREPRWTSNFVRTFAERDGVLVMTSFEGRVFRVQGGRFEELPDVPGVQGRGRAGHVDGRGRVWTVQNGFFGFWDGKVWQAGEAEEEVTNGFRSATTALDGSLLVFRGASLLRIVDGRVVSRARTGVVVGDVWQMREAADGTIWLGTVKAGLFACVPDGPSQRYNTLNGLQHDEVRFVFEDREKNLWAGGGGGGLVRLKPRTFIASGSEKGTRGRPVVRAVTEDSQGRILLGTWGDGLDSPDRNVVPSALNEGKGLSNAYIHCLLPDRSGVLWAGTFQRGLHRRANDQWQSIPTAQSGGSSVHALFEDSQGRVWIGGNTGVMAWAGGQFTFMGRGKKNMPRVRSFAEERADGSIWAATPDGLFRFANDTWTETLLADGHPVRDVSFLHCDTNGALWLGGARLGLRRWQGGRWSVIDLEHGLPTRSLFSMLEDSSGHWWLGSDLGVLRMRGEELPRVADGRQAALRCDLFNRSDGMPSASCAEGATSVAFKDGRGRLWFATHKGAAMVEPERLRLNTNPPPVAIEQVTYMDREGREQVIEVEPGVPVVLPPGSAAVGVRYTGLSFTAPEKMRFSYRLGRPGAPWVNAGERRSLSFPTIGHGKTTLTVRAANNDGFWNGTGATLALTVQPFVWQTAWFRGLGLCVLMGGAGLGAWKLARSKLRHRIEALERERAVQAERTRLAQLGGELSAATQSRQAAQILADAAQDLLGWDACFLRARSVDLRRAYYELNVDTINGRRVSVTDSVLDEITPIERRVMSEGPVLILRENLEAAEKFRMFGDRNRPSASLMYVPMRHRGRYLGIFSIQSYKKAAYTEGSLKLLEALVEQTVGAFERLRAEATLIRSETQLRLVWECTQDAMRLTDAQGIVCRVNEAYCRLMNTGRDQIEGFPFVTPYAEETHAPLLERYRERVRDLAIPTVVQTEIRLRNGDRRVVELSNAQVTPPGEAALVLSVFRDVTERRRAERALRESEERFRELAENIQEVFWVAAAGEERFFYVSPAYEAIWGRSCASLYEQPASWAASVHAGERERFTRAKRGEGFDLEYRILRPDGEVRWIHDRAFPVHDAEGSVVRVVGVAEDITAKKRAEEDVKRLAAFPQLNPNPVFEITEEGGMTYCNAAAAAMARDLGFAEPAAMLPAGTAAVARECIVTGKSRTRLEVPCGKRIISWSFHPIPAQRAVHCYAGDITERRQLEEQFRQSQKMEAVGQLAGGVAHDFNNILTIIQGHVGLVSTLEPLPDGALESIRDIGEAAERAANLTRQLLTFSRRQIMQPRDLNLNALVANMARMLRRILGEDITLDLKSSAGLPAVNADPGMMEQVLLNLGVNARDAMPRGGELTIRTSVEDVTAEAARQTPDAASGRFVCLSVSDTGSGIAPDHLPHIFEPFFTTKDVGKGTGLGLATVYGIVKQHRGWLAVTSELGRGTTFKIHLPALRVSGEMSEARREIERAPGGTETILLVEDERMVRQIARTLLRRLGYRVFEAESGADALRVWEEAGGKVDLLLTDLVMPGGLNGRELAAQLLAKQPGMKVIFTSGYSADVMGKDFTVEADAHFLQKPYELPVLAGTIRRALDEQTGA